MLGWLFPRPPVNPVEKAWIETRMLRLAGHLGLPRLLDARMIMPVEDIIPANFGGTQKDAEEILSRLCESSRIPVGQLQLRVDTPGCHTQPRSENEAESEQAANTISMGPELLYNPYAVAATTARVLALRQLPTRSLAGESQAQVAWIADIAAIYLGWGVIVAHELTNAATQQHACGCGAGQPDGFPPARMLGYSLALFAFARGEKSPSWRNSLSLDALAACNRSLRYLHRTSDSLFTRERARQQPSSQSRQELLNQLNSGSHSARVAALWELCSPEHAEDAAEPVAACLHDRVPAIRAEAAQTIAQYGATARHALPALIDLLQDSNHSIRAAAARALGKIGTDSTELFNHLTELLRESNRLVVHNAAVAISGLGRNYEAAIPDLLGALRGAVIRCDHELIDTLVNALYALDPDPTKSVMEHFQDDPELQQQVAHIIVATLGDQPSEQ